MLAVAVLAGACLHPALTVSACICLSAERLPAPAAPACICQCPGCLPVSACTECLPAPCAHSAHLCPQCLPAPCIHSSCLCPQSLPALAAQARAHSSFLTPSAHPCPHCLSPVLLGAARWGRSETYRSMAAFRGAARPLPCTLPCTLPAGGCGCSRGRPSHASYVVLGGAG